MISILQEIEINDKKRSSTLHDSAQMFTGAGAINQKCELIAKHDLTIIDDKLGDN